MMRPYSETVRAVKRDPKGSRFFFPFCSRMRPTSRLSQKPMSLLRLDKAGLHYGTLTLLEEVDFTISRGEKIGLLGRNGAGKTSFLKVLTGENALDAGERWVRPGTRIAWLQQELPHADQQ